MRYALFMLLAPAFILVEAPRPPDATAKPPTTEQAPAEKPQRRRVVMPDGRVMDLWYDEELKCVVPEPR